MIDQEGINSLNTGAEPITYEGTEGPKSPEQDQAMALGLPEGLTLDEAVKTFDLAFPKKANLRGMEKLQEVIKYFRMQKSEGPIFPSDEDPINPFGPKPMEDSRQMAAFGGIMGLDNRKQYGLGSKFKRILNKVTSPITKVAQKLVPKELAGPLRTIAPFLPPGYREAAYLAGTAKQKGRFNIGDLAFAAAPYARFSKAANSDILKGQGTFGTDTDFRFGTAQPGDYGIRDLITGGEAGGAYEQRGGKGILGQIKLGESDLGQMSDEFIFGKPQTQGQQGQFEGPVEGSVSQDQYLRPDGTLGGIESRSFDTEGVVENLVPGQRTLGGTGYQNYIPGTSAQSGILGMGGEMSVLGGAGGAPGIMDSKAGQTLFGDGKGGVSKLKIGSWAVGIVSGIKAGKYADEQEAALAAEEALLATNQAASDAEVQAARDWAISTFGNMSVYADGGRINKNMGGEFNMPPAGLSSLQTQVSDVTPQGMELDLRGGGFIPIGKAEKADDVPARVSKNEFVFTADAVKAAGGGSVNEGAKRMYDTMKRLESQVG